MAFYEVTLEGFTVNNQTWDHALNVDGWADEVRVTSDIHLLDQSGSLLSRSVRNTDWMGDTNGFPNRVRAGSASRTGGLKNGDSFPAFPPFQRQGDLQQNRPPMRLWAGDLSDDVAVTITPVIWEWDGGADLFNSWGQSLVTNAPAIAAAIANLIALFNGAPPVAGTAIQSSLSTGLPPLFRLLQDIVGVARDRPIGMIRENGNFVFRPQSVVMNNRVGQLVVQHDFGYGPGVIGIPYVDDPQLRGDYMLYIRVMTIGAMNDGMLWRERSNPPVFVTYGGAKFWIPSAAVLDLYGGWQAVQEVPDGSLATVPNVPRDGTLIREISDARVYLIQGGQRRWVTRPEILPNYGRWEDIRRIPDGGTQQVPPGADITA